MPRSRPSATAAVAGAVIVDRDAARRARLPGRHASAACPRTGCSAAAARARSAVGVVDWTVAARRCGRTNPFEAPTFAVVDAGRGGGGRAAAAGRRHGRVRQPADRRHRVRGPVVPDARVLRAVGRVGRRVGEGEPGHGAADLRGDRAAAGHRQDPGHRAGRADPGAARARARRSWCWSGPGGWGTRCSGEDPAAATSLAGLSPGLVAAFLVYFTLGFALYAALYAGGGLAAEPRRGPPDHRPAALDPRDHGLPARRPRAVRRHVGR